MNFFEIITNNKKYMKTKTILNVLFSGLLISTGSLHATNCPCDGGTAEYSVDCSGNGVMDACSSDDCPPCSEKNPNPSTGMICCDGVEKPIGFKCCTPAQKTEYENILQVTLLDNEYTWITDSEAVDQFYDDFRAELVVERENLLTHAENGYNWQMAACLNSYPGDDAIDTSLRLACETGANIAHGVAQGTIWAAYGSGVAGANVAQVAQLAALIVVKNSADSQAQSERDAACDNWS